MSHSHSPRHLATTEASPATPATPSPRPSRGEGKGEGQRDPSSLGKAQRDLPALKPPLICLPASSPRERRGDDAHPRRLATPQANAATPTPPSPRPLRGEGKGEGQRHLSSLTPPLICLPASSPRDRRGDETNPRRLATPQANAATPTPPSPRPSRGEGKGEGQRDPSSLGKAQRDLAALTQPLICLPASSPREKRGEEGHPRRLATSEANAATPTPPSPRPLRGEGKGEGQRDLSSLGEGQRRPPHQSAEALA
jgi:hypothetical protein